MRWLAVALIARVFSVGCDCGTPQVPPSGPDGSVPDAGAGDAGAPDAGAPDAGTPDAGHAAGTLDLAFGDAGLVVLSLTASDQLFALAVQPDEKIVGVGSSATFTRMGFVRLNADGTPDVTFGPTGTGGFTLTLAPGSTDLAFATALTPDGGIVAMGSSTGGTTQTQFAVVKLTPSGNLDPGFGMGGQGFSVLPVGNLPDNAAGLALQPDGRIVLAGVTQATDGGDFAAVRLLATGNLDPTLNGTGFAVFATPANDTQNGVAVQSDGSIVVSGKSDDRASLARFTASGMVDTTFADAGLLVDDLSPGLVSQYQAVLVQPDGNLVAVGYLNNTSTIAVVRYGATGLRDPSFGANGVASVAIAGAAYAGFLDSHGRIVLTAHTNDAFVVGRLLPTGAPDTSFGPAGLGWITIDFGGALQFPFAVVEAPNGEIVVGGMSANRFAIARIWP